MQLAALLLLAALIRLPGIVMAPFWSDEYFSWVTATQPSFIQFFLRCAGVDVYPPLGYLPSWLLAKLSDAAWVLRLPAALAGLACVWAAHRLLKGRVSPGQALFGAALVALSPLSVYLGWEAKAYNVFALMNLLMLDEALRIQEDPKRGWKRLALWTAGSMYSFFLSPYFILAMLAGAWWNSGGWTPAFKKILKGAVAGMLLALPLLPFFIKTLLLYASSSAYNTALAKAPFYSFENFSAGFWPDHRFQLLALALYALAAACFFITRDIPRALKGALAWMALLPPPLFVLVSALGKPNYNDRAMLAGALCWGMLCGLGALSLKGPKRAILAALLILTPLLSLAAYAWVPGDSRVDYGRAWSQINRDWREGDLIMHAYFESGLPFKYYAAREAKISGQAPKGNYVHMPDPGFSASATAQGIRGAWRRLNAWLAERGMRVEAGLDPIFVDGEKLEAATHGARRLWYVVASPEAARRQMMQIPNGYRGGQPLGRDFDFAKETWMQGRWRLAGESGDDEIRIYLFVPGR